jgi:2-polyprenyl-6-methoxyphenol hydroxylase-like FAD-dependent oxidoreductase
MVSNSLSGKQAVVLGGGMAGLLAARVLTEHFEQVSLIERDYYPEDPVFRPGVPQGRHVHILLLRGQQILEELFPGIRRDLVARGAIECDFLNDYPFRLPSGWLTRSPSQLLGYVSTRFLLEWQVRQALIKNPQIQILEGHEVVNVVAGNDAQSITGVSLRTRPRSGLAEQNLTQVAADLVVDATGRDSKAPQWLKSLGYAPPLETVINPFFGYATRLYVPPPDPRRDWKGMVIQYDPPRNLRGGVIWPTEEGHWMVVLGGTGKDYPPTDEDAFLEFARSLPDSALFETIREAQPLSPIYGYRQTENRWRHFERLQRQPERFLVLGDAACVLNPVYGQGMTVAALGTIALRDSLRQCGRNGLSGLARRFQRKLARVNASAWTLATATDIRVPTVEGASIKWGAKWQYYYLDRLVQLLPHDPPMSYQFLRVIHMVEQSTVLFSPSVAMKVLFRQK